MPNTVEIIDIEWDGDIEAIVTWAFIDGGVPITCSLELDYQPEESDVGVGAGYGVHGDAPEEVLEKVAAEAIERDDHYHDPY